jgi:hypothetical protein
VNAGVIQVPGPERICSRAPFLCARIPLGSPF